MQDSRERKVAKRAPDALACAIRALGDRIEIGEIPHHYGRAVDARDQAAVLSLFTSEAFIDGSRRALPARDYYRELMVGLARYYAVTMHSMHNQIVALDSDRGVVETYAVARHWTPESRATSTAADLTLGVNYRDEVRRTAEGWRIAARKVTPLWREGAYPPDWT
ncbi:MAG: nuclear transport factor 2 family protein [Sphingomonas sp.]